MERERFRVLEESTTLHGNYSRHWVQAIPGDDWHDDQMPVSAVTSSTTEGSNDVEVPGWRRTLAAGGIVNNPFRQSLQRTVNPGLVEFAVAWFQPYASNIPKTAGYDLDGLVGPTCAYGATRVQTLDVVDASVIAGLRQEAIDEAVTKAHANVSVAEMAGLATLAEGSKTVQSMVSILKRVISISKSVKKLNLRALKKEISPQELADRYMELRYAIRPLVYDVVGISEALKQPKGIARRTFRGNASRSYYRTDKLTNQVVRLNLGTDLTREVTYTVSAQAGVLAEVNVDMVSSFGFDQPIEAMWELMPFSFIIDWFFNAGQTLAAHTPNAAISERASWVTTKEILVAMNMSGESRCTLPSTPYTTRSGSCAPFEYGNVQKVHTREVSPVLSTLPSFQLHLDTYKLLDLGIILQKLMK